MKADYLSDRIGRQALQESTKGCFIGQRLQSQEGMEKSIVSKLVGFADPLHTGDQKKQNHAEQINRIEFRTAGSRTERALQAASKIELMTKPLNQEQTAIVGQGVRFERKTQ